MCPFFCVQQQGGISLLVLQAYSDWLESACFKTGASLELCASGAANVGGCVGFSRDPRGFRGDPCGMLVKCVGVPEQVARKDQELKLDLQRNDNQCYLWLSPAKKTFPKTCGRKWPARKPRELSKKATREQEGSRKRKNIHKNIRKRNTSTTSFEQVPAPSHDHWQSPLHNWCLDRHGALRNDNCDNGCLIARIQTKRTRILSRHMFDICAAFARRPRACLKQGWPQAFSQNVDASPLATSSAARDCSPHLP